MAEFPPAQIRPVAAEVAKLLKEKKETVSVAETAAGGLISAALIAQAGASAFYRGGLTVYTLESRVEYAGWTEADYKDYRGPTTDIVAGLATNTRTKLGSTYCVSESGTAGPTSPNRPVGYVALAVASEKGVFKKELSTGLGGDREGNMVAFAVEALTLLRDVLKGDAKL
ncbi:putative competence protein CinA [Coleophoma crateriformis]|uniref:Putative competence protein CinA n=1 Tax=Coleophoma crateriformis TaxID=565419 RepID=A0A3D8SN51_9HELO|nr:putative competence protein CinA [Coleophoma crateriformis]